MGEVGGRGRVAHPTVSEKCQRNTRIRAEASQAQETSQLVGESGALKAGPSQGGAAR